MSKLKTPQTKSALQTTAVVVAPNFMALPIGEDNFSNLRAKGKIYVDKTDLIELLTQHDHAVFMARPRRFGKSLLCSTLYELFTRGTATEAFRGLAIEQKWHEAPYPVIYISFADADVDATDDINAVDEAIFSLIDDQLNSPYNQQFLQAANIDVTAYKSLFRKPRELLRKVLFNYHNNTGKQFVVLFDEYDALLNDVINNQESLEQRVQWFSSFFRILKGLHSNKCLRFLFITGVTRYSHTGIFSGCNNFSDLSADVRFCSLFGYTEQEIQQYFQPYIEYGAHLFGITTSEYLDILRQEYDGYCFSSAQEATKVYNPVSIIESCNQLSQGNLGLVFNSFWVQTGSISTYLVNFFKQQLHNARVKGSTSDLLEFLSTDLVSDFTIPLNLLTTVRNPYQPDDTKDLLTEFRVALIQAGYYTIKRSLPSVSEALKNAGNSPNLSITVPNHEVSQDLRNNFWPKIKSFLRRELNDLCTSSGLKLILLLNVVQTGEPNQVMAAINEQFSQFSKNSHIFEHESTLRSILASMLRFDGQLVEKLSLITSFNEATPDEFVFYNPSNDDEDEGLDDNKKVTSVSKVLEVSEEKLSPKGFADIFVSTKKLNVVFELKRTDLVSDTVLDNKLHEALNQIKTRRYYKQYPQRDTLCYAVVFSENKQRVERLAVFKHSKAGRNSKVRYADPLPADN